MPSEDYSDDVPVLEPLNDHNEDSKNENENRIKRPSKLRCLQQLDYLFDEEREHIVFKQRVTCLLNKISRKSFHKFVKLFEKLLSENPKRYELALNILIDRAVNDPLFGPIYADLACTILYPFETSNQEERSFKIFGFAFTEKILELFREIPELRPLNENETEAELLGTITLEERKRINRLKSLGVCRIIGGLFKIGIISEDKLCICIDRLFHRKDENIFLECIYVLFVSIGKYFSAFSDLETLDGYFDIFEDIVRSEDLAVSNRIRILLMNLIDFKRKSWV